MSQTTITLTFATSALALAALTLLEGKSVAATVTADKPAVDKPATQAKTKLTTSAKPKSEHSKEDVEGALTKLMERDGKDSARAIVKELGFARMSEITEEKYDEAFALAEAAWEAGDAV